MALGARSVTPPPIRHGHAQSQLGVGLDLHIDVSTGKQLRRKQISDDARVMQWRTSRAIFGNVKALKEVGHLGHGFANICAQSTKCVVAGFGHQRLVGHIQR